MSAERDAGKVETENVEMEAARRDWTIGIVGEGPTDYALLNGLIRRITGCTRDCRRIQPEKPLTPGGLPGGWKGVARWCREKRMETGPGGGFLLDGVPFDLLVIHMDGDVSRSADNRVVHCLSGCPSARLCGAYGADPLRCDVGGCPVESPCPCHTPDAAGYSGHLRQLTLDLLDPPESVRGKVCPVVPCDSTEAWLVAAFEGRTDAEEIPDPWAAILKNKKVYSYRGSDKHESSYIRYLLPTLLDRWEAVKGLCTMAARFERDLLSALTPPSGV